MEWKKKFQTYLFFFQNSRRGWCWRKRWSWFRWRGWRQENRHWRSKLRFRLERATLNEILNVTWYQFFLFFKDYHSDNLVQNSRTSNYGLSQDIKKPLGGLISSDLSSSHPGHAHAFSHYSQMGMTAAKSHMMGGTVPGGGMTPPTGAHPAATHRSSITDFFGKMMSFSSCQTPVLPSYYQNSMYSTEKIDSHLWFGSFVWEKIPPKPH